MVPSSPGTQKFRISNSRCREGLTRMGGRQRLTERLLPNYVACNMGALLEREFPGKLPARPKPTEGARNQHGVNHAINDFLDGHAPGLSLPDAIAEVGQTVREERRCAGYLEDSPKGLAVCHHQRVRVRGDIRNNDT